jgi:GNAT superfamily N-acetyltransferase
MESEFKESGWRINEIPAFCINLARRPDRWKRFFDQAEAVHALVAELDGRVVGITHFLFHRSTSRLSDVCYLQDLFTEESCRGRGVGRALIQRVLNTAKEAGSSRVYWTTQTSNVAGRALYDKMADHRGFIVYSHEF